MVERPRAIESVDLQLLGGHLVARAAVDDHPSPRRFDQQRPHRELDAIPLIGRRQLLPQGARHHTEHRSAIEPEGTIVEACQLQIAERQPRDFEPDIGLRALLQFDQDAVSRRRMDERDERAFGTRPRLCVDRAAHHEPSDAPTPREGLRHEA